MMIHDINGRKILEVPVEERDWKSYLSKKSLKFLDDMDKIQLEYVEGSLSIDQPIVHITFYVDPSTMDGAMELSNDISTGNFGSRASDRVYDWYMNGPKFDEYEEKYGRDDFYSLLSASFEENLLGGWAELPSNEYALIAAHAYRCLPQIVDDVMFLDDDLEYFR